MQIILGTILALVLIVILIRVDRAKNKSDEEPEKLFELSGKQEFFNFGMRGDRGRNPSRR